MDSKNLQILLRSVGKRYRYEWIFRNIDLTLVQGQKYAILGPNGSGKSTLLRILCAHLSPSEGKIEFSQLKNIIESDTVYQHLSFAAPYVELVEELTLKETINFHLRFQKLQNALNCENLIELLGFQKSANKEVRFFSSGMKQRLKLALACCSDSKLLILDEPTTNLDRQGIEWYQSLTQNYLENRLVIVASNTEVDYNFCTQTIDLQQFKN